MHGVCSPFMSGPKPRVQRELSHVETRTHEIPVMSAPAGKPVTHPKKEATSRFKVAQGLQP